MIELQNVNKWYGDYHALVDVNEIITTGEVVVVCGPSGSGKSTLIRTINRLEEIQGGRILADGQDVHAPQQNVNALASCFSSSTCFRTSRCWKTARWPRCSSKS